MTGDSPFRLTARIRLAYDGTDFHGWQAQPGLRTVQGEIHQALRGLIPGAIEGLPPGAGRTDAGVHARGQVCSVALRDEEHFERIARALPRLLPPDIAVQEILREGPDFHARYCATARHYAYRFTFERDPFLRRNHLEIDPQLDLEAMAAACAPLLGEHDATSLCRRSSLEEGRTRCVIDRAELVWTEKGGTLHLRADRFLHSMVRIIVGTLLEVGRGRRDVDTLVNVLAARDRGAAGDTAPAVGLSLEEVEYRGGRRFARSDSGAGPRPGASSKTETKG